MRKDLVCRLASREERPDAHRRQVIARLVDEAAKQFDGARVVSYVPLLIEHLVRQQITDARSTEMRERAEERQAERGRSAGRSDPEGTHRHLKINRRRHRRS
jgi:hypothetical protein